MERIELRSKLTAEDRTGIHKIMKGVVYGVGQDMIKAQQDYSFFIQSPLFQTLTKEQQGMWRKEIEQAFLGGSLEMLNKILCWYFWILGNFSVEDNTEYLTSDEAEKMKEEALRIYNDIVRKKGNETNGE